MFNREGNSKERLRKRNLNYGFLIQFIRQLFSFELLGTMVKGDCIYRIIHPFIFIVKDDDATNYHSLLTIEIERALDEIFTNDFKRQEIESLRECMNYFDKRIKSDRQSIIRKKIVEFIDKNLDPIRFTDDILRRGTARRKRRVGVGICSDTSSIIYSGPVKTEPYNNNSDESIFEEKKEKDIPERIISPPKRPKPKPRKNRPLKKKEIKIGNKVSKEQENKSKSNSPNPDKQMSPKSRSNKNIIKVKRTGRSKIPPQRKVISKIKATREPEAGLSTERDYSLGIRNTRSRLRLPGNFINLKLKTIRSRTQEKRDIKKKEEKLTKGTKRSSKNRIDKKKSTTSKKVSAKNTVQIQKVIPDNSETRGSLNLSSPEFKSNFITLPTEDCYSSEDGGESSFVLRRNTSKQLPPDFADDKVNICKKETEREKSLTKTSATDTLNSIMSQDDVYKAFKASNTSILVDMPKELIELQRSERIEKMKAINGLFKKEIESSPKKKSLMKGIETRSVRFSKAEISPMGKDYNEPEPN